MCYPGLYIYIVNDKNLLSTNKIQNIYLSFDIRYCTVYQ